MVFKKATQSAAVPFQVPSHGDVDADYREIEHKIAALQASQSAATRAGEHPGAVHHGPGQRRRGQGRTFVARRPAGARALPAFLR